MSERLNAAVDGITDSKWSLLKALTGKDEISRDPEYITVTDAKIIKLLGRIVPLRFMPFVVNQWAGIEGRKAFENELKKVK